MVTATPEEIAMWPAPNFQNPESRGMIVIGLTASTMALVVVFSCVRFYGKGILRQAFGVDDWIMLVAALFSVPVSVFAMVSVKYGLGLHLWDQKAQWATPYYKLFTYLPQMAFAADILFPLSCSLTKISLCTTYLRLFPTRSNRVFCYVLSMFVTLYTTTCIFLMLFQCTPIRGYWDASAKQHCINLQATLISIAAMNSLSDFLIYLWPAKPLWSLQLPLKQRLGLIFIFAVGCTVCVAGICRIYYLEVYFNSYDLLWNASVIYVVMCIEMNIGITFGCLSGVKPVLAVTFPRLFTSSHRTDTRPTIYGRTRTTHNQSFPFEPLSDISKLSRAKDRKLEHTVSIKATNPENKEQRNSAWASSGGDTDPAVPHGAIAVNQVVMVQEEHNVLRKSEKGDTGSEEWMMGDLHEPARR